MARASITGMLANEAQIPGRSAPLPPTLHHCAAYREMPGKILNTGLPISTGRIQWSEMHTGGFQRARNRAIAAIDITPELLDAVFVDPGRAIGEDDGQRLIERNMLLAPALQDLVKIGAGIPCLVGQQIFGQLMRLF